MKGVDLIPITFNLHGGANCPSTYFLINKPNLIQRYLDAGYRLPKCIPTHSNACYCYDGSQYCGSIRERHKIGTMLLQVYRKCAERARSAAITLLCIKKFHPEHWLLRFTNKDVLRLIAKLVWASGTLEWRKWREDKQKKTKKKKAKMKK